MFSIAKKMANRMASKIFLTAALIFFIHPAWAVVETDPGDYIPLPAGTNLAVLYYQHAERDSYYINGEKANFPFKLDTDLAIARYVHFFDVAGLRANVQAIVPFASVRESLPGSLTSNGAGDPFVGANLWLLNDQAAQRYLALGAFLAIPIGSYDASKGGVNPGENRWKGVFHLSYGQQIIGRLGLDVTGEYAVYGENDDYIGSAYQQRPTFEVQSHLRYALTPLTTLAVSYIWTMGGRTSLGGVDQNDRINTGRYLLTVAHMFGPTLQLEGQVGQDVHVSNGAKERFRINVRLLKLF
jgi:hypothetical protein